MGRYYEDFTVGDTYKHWPGRTITATDNTWFTLLTMNQHPIHFDEAYAARSEFGKPLVNSAFTLAVVVGMSVADVSQFAVANLGWTDIALPAPVFNGDTLYAESTVLEKSESRSKPDRGILYVETRCWNQREETVLTLRRKVLMAKRPVS